MAIDCNQSALSRHAKHQPYSISEQLVAQLVARIDDGRLPPVSSLVKLGLPSRSSNSWAPPQSPPHAPCNGSIAAPSNTLVCVRWPNGDFKQLGLAADGNWRASSSPKALPGQSGHQENNCMGRHRTTAATHSTSLQFNHSTSPLTQAASFPRRNSPSSLPAPPAKQPARTKLKDCNDMNTDLDDIQHLMRKEGHT